MAVYMAACSKSDSSIAPAAPISTAGITLDLTSATYVGLKTIGGYAYTGNIIVAHVKDGSYIALSKVCTHQGTTVQYIAASDNIYCPNHGAMYSDTGAVTQGPAMSSLTQYKATLSQNGQSLIITNGV